MNIQEMERFLAVIQSGSITSAAAKLYISPQGLSSLIKRMETEFGVPLLERNNNGVFPTEYGKLVADKFKGIIKQYDEMLNEMSDLKRLQNGMIRMVSAYGVLRKMTPEFIFSFHENHPDIQLDYMEFPDQYIEEMIWEEKADIGFTIGPVDDERFDKIFLYEEDIMLLVQANHELAEKERINIHDISDYKFVIESNMFKLHNTFIQKCRQHGFEPDIVFNTSGFVLCHKLCAQGKGLSLTLESNFFDMSTTGLKFLPFDEEFKWQIYMITKKNRDRGKNVDELMKHAINWHIN